jgi:hypothetical protein
MARPPKGARDMIRRRAPHFVRSVIKLGEGAVFTTAAWNNERMPMSMSVADLMTANLLAVFNERDEVMRRNAIERTYATTVRWTDSAGVVSGRADLETKCAALQSNLGDLQFEFDGPLYELPGFAHLAWRLVDAAGQVHLTGFDAAVIENGLIADLWTVVIPPQ